MYQTNEIEQFKQMKGTGILGVAARVQKLDTNARSQSA